MVRDAAKGEAVRAELAAEQGDVFTLHVCDLGDLDAVAVLADDLAAADLPLAALVHNAGALPATRTESPQGHELSMALHVLSPVLLTERLRPGLAAHRTRVVMVTSGGMYAQPLRDDDPEYLKGDYSGTTAYARSKRVQVELLPVLQQRWPELASTRCTRAGPTLPAWSSRCRRSTQVTGPVLRDLHQGVDTAVWLAAVEPAAGGRHAVARPSAAAGRPHPQDPEHARAGRPDVGVGARDARPPGRARLRLSCAGRRRSALGGQGDRGVAGGAGLALGERPVGGPEPQREGQRLPALADLARRCRRRTGAPTRAARRRPRAAPPRPRPR